jgi:ornithine cyclodeaminase
MQAAHIIVDKREAALHEAGDLLIPIHAGDLKADAIRGELGEAVAGKVIGRPSADSITLFESLGQAVEDVATADWVYRQAAKKGMGVKFSFQ